MYFNLIIYQNITITGYVTDRSVQIFEWVSNHHYHTWLTASGQFCVSRLFFRVQKQVKAKPRFILILERALSARRFPSLELYFLFFTATIRFTLFSSWRSAKIKMRAQGRALQAQSQPHISMGQYMMTELDSFCINPCFTF